MICFLCYCHSTWSVVSAYVLLALYPVVSVHFVVLVSCCSNILLFQYMFSYFSVCYVVSVSSSFSICSVVSELAGPKCIIEGNGFVLPFFPAAAKKPSFGRYGTLSGSTSVIVGLPCRYSPDSVELHFCDCNSWYCQANTRLTTMAILSADTSSKHQTDYSGDPISWHSQANVTSSRPFHVTLRPTSDWLLWLDPMSGHSQANATPTRPLYSGRRETDYSDSIYQLTQSGQRHTNSHLSGDTQSTPDWLLWLDLSVDTVRPTPHQLAPVSWHSVQRQTD